MDEKLEYSLLCKCTYALVVALKERDLHTQIHSESVENISHEIGNACGLSQEDIMCLRVAACFHDIGKIGIPDDILLKPGQLTSSEWEIMKSHSEKSENIVRQLQLKHCHVIAQAVRHHHEYYNGNGYPDGLSGNDIPYLSRIIAVVDSYDAMTRPRPYHQVRTHKKAIDIIFEEEGSKFEPYIVRIFENTIRFSSYKAK